ncbi:helix-hairpin-helix domain-containing protein [Haloplanus litoreus]|uniref:DNA polymerase beta n=1 Tax=Haloplanus litoreus TaxID=767515 RepID=A0ABD5ZXC3_9EURY
MKNRAVAERLREIADFLAIREVEYKPRAYRTAARNVESLSEPIEDVYDRGDLQEIEGVGESIAEKIADYLDTGEMSYYRELRTDLPIDIEAITSVQGVGPKTAKRLYLDLDVRTLEDLERAAEAGRIAELDGFGEKSQANILDNIERAKRGQERMLLGHAFPIARDVERRLDESDAFDRVDTVGSFRRRRPTVGDVDVLATATDPEAAMETFCTHGDVSQVFSRGETGASVLVGDDLRIDLRIVADEEYGAALVYFTGSKAHNIALRNRAIDRDWKLNEYGLFDVGEARREASETPRETGGDDGQRAGERIAGDTEEAVYAALDLAWIPPELREDTGEIDAAAANDLPDLVATDDVRGDLQCHTDYSDGSHSVREMAVAADEHGLEYLLVTDHGPEAPIPSTLDADAFDAQRADVEDVNADDEISVTILQGIETEITESGLGVPDDWCDRCDLVVAGLHSRPDEPTERVVRALREAPVDVLAHPTGRLLTERDPLDLNLDAVLGTAAEEGVAVEINAQPRRLDLDWQAVAEYRDTADFVVSTDAHTTGELDFLHLGVAQARRGWCDASDVLNTRSLDDLRSAFGD